MNQTILVQKKKNSLTHKPKVGISELIFPIINILCMYCHLLSMSNYFFKLNTLPLPTPIANVQYL